MASSDSRTTHGLLVHGTRRIYAGSMDIFRADFDTWVVSNNGLLAAFAFPDPAEPESLVHMLLWFDSDLMEAGPPSSKACSSTAEDPDVLNLYGGGSANSHDDTVRLTSMPALSGYMRPCRPAADAGESPMIGLFRRAIKPGRLDALASSFQVVTDIWFRGVPGILAAFVCPDPEDAAFVHDIRIFADRASYAAHVDKSNPELTEGMEVWFGNYDTSVPHEGALYAEDTRDPSMRTSSMKDKPVKVAFNQFHYGEGGMVGTVPKRIVAAAV